MFLNCCKSFAFVAGPCSMQYIIIKHVLIRARDELCKARELQMLLILLTHFNFIGKHICLVHMLYAVPVHPSLCKYMKRCSVVVKLWIAIIVSYANL